MTDELRRDSTCPPQARPLRTPSPGTTRKTVVGVSCTPGPRKTWKGRVRLTEVTKVAGEDGTHGRTERVDGVEGTRPGEWVSPSRALDVKEGKVDGHVDWTGI